MAGKNHHRYKIRKRMNQIKHEPKRLFEEPPVLIHNWEELSKATSETHYLEIDIRNCNGHVRPKPGVECDNDSYYFHNKYLSTHTFYGGSYYYYTSKLRKLGFNIQLENWDGETIFCRH